MNDPLARYAERPNIPIRTSPSKKNKPSNFPPKSINIIIIFLIVIILILFVPLFIVNESNQSASKPQKPQIKETKIKEEKEEITNISIKNWLESKTLIDNENLNENLNIEINSILNFAWLDDSKFNNFQNQNYNDKLEEEKLQVLEAKYNEFSNFHETLKTKMKKTQGFFLFY